MTRLLKYLILALLTVVLVVMAFANRQPVTLSLLPPDIAALVGLNAQIDLPLFLVLALGVVAGLLVGFTWEWLREHKHRRTASTKSREASRLERELAALRDQTHLPDDDVLAILEKPKAR